MRIFTIFTIFEIFEIFDLRTQPGVSAQPPGSGAGQERATRRGNVAVDLVKRVWIPVVMIVVLAAGAVTVSRLHRVFGSHHHLSDAGNGDAIVSFNQKRVVYEVLGPPGTLATINYLDADAQPQQVDDARLPWALTIVTTLSAVVADVVAQGDSDSLGCRITVDGVIRGERFVEAHHAQTSCLVKSA